MEKSEKEEKKQERALEILKCKKCGMEYIFDRFSKKCTEHNCGGDLEETTRKIE